MLQRKREGGKSNTNNESVDDSARGNKQLTNNDNEVEQQQQQGNNNNNNRDNEEVQSPSNAGVNESENYDAHNDTDVSLPSGRIQLKRRGLFSSNKVSANTNTNNNVHTRKKERIILKGKNGLYYSPEKNYGTLKPKREKIRLKMKCYPDFSSEENSVDSGHNSHNFSSDSEEY